MPADPILVTRSYRRGVQTVLATVALAGILCAARVDTRAGPPPAGRDLGPEGFALGSFRLLDQTGAPVTDADLAHRPWIAAFIFTRCPASCPRISAVMRSLQDKLSSTPVDLVSISVDPDRDTPAVLDRYAVGLKKPDDEPAIDLCINGRPLAWAEGLSGLWP